MANFDITNASSLIEIDEEKSLLAFDNKNIYKLKLNEDSQKILVAAGLLVGSKGNSASAEIFNDYENNQASGEYSHAEGRGTRATTECMHVQGAYNFTTSNFLHVVGNGTKDNPSDAYRLDWDGNAEFKGDVADGEGTTIRSLKNTFDATGSGNRRPIVYFADSEPTDNNIGEIGDIYCYIIS